MKKYKLDDRDRAIVPASIRHEYDLSNSAIVLGDRHLMLMPAWHLEGMADSITGTNETSRRMSRRLCSGTYITEIDEKGRIVIPDYLREPAQISDSVMYVEVPNKHRVQIWDPNQWKKYHN
jgi:MraZ protein